MGNTNLFKRNAGSNSEKHVFLLGLERAGKTHMLYTRLVAEGGGMNTIKKLCDTNGFNCEEVEESIVLNVWDIAGSPELRPAWRQLYLKNIPLSGIVYVVNVSEDMERLKESRDTLHLLANEPLISAATYNEDGVGCSVLAVVYNNKPPLISDGSETKI